MDRERIERRDFPTGRRGYDPAAVDEHLRRVADEFEAHVHAPRASLADSTSEQVRLILDAAERGADELRSRAGEEASDHVARVEAAAGGMLSKLDALESELTACSAALRASGERLAQGLAELQAEVSGAVPAASPPPAEPSPPDPAPPVAAASPPEPPSSDAPDGAPAPAPRSRPVRGGLRRRRARRRRRAADRAQHGARRQPARGDRALPRRALRARRCRSAAR